MADVLRLHNPTADATAEPGRTPGSAVFSFHLPPMPQALEQQLDSVQAAIARIETGGQEQSRKDRSLREGELATLYRRERDLKAAINRRNRGGRLRTRRIVHL